MISDATEMSNPVARVWPFSVAAWPVVMPRRNRSLTSRTRLQDTAAGSMSSRTNAALSSSDSSSASPNFSAGIPSFRSLRSMTGAKGLLPVLPSSGHRRPNSAASDCVASWNMRASTAAAQRLLAAVIAWMSPVRCRLSDSIGMICE